MRVIRTKLIRTLVADNHFFYCRQTINLLATSPEISIVGQASSAVEAAAQAVKYTPDVILLDIALPGFSGSETIRQLLEINPQTGVIVLTADDDELVCRAVHAGARGYLPKEVEPEALLQAVRAVAGGQAVFGAPIASRLPAFFVAQPAPACARLDLPPTLTTREREIAHLMTRGLRNREIANRLFVSEKTVRNVSGRLFKKLGVTNRCQAIAKITSPNFDL